MIFDDFSVHARQIQLLEFTRRDRDIQSGVSNVKQELNARGLLHSTMTIQALADFLLAEFEARSAFVAEHALFALRTDGANVPGSVHAPAGLEMFRSVSAEQLVAIRNAYDEGAQSVVTALQSNMPDQIRTDLVTRMHSHLLTRTLALELEYKLAENRPNDVLTLRPTVYGVGIDLKELWRKFFK